MSPWFPRFWPLLAGAGTLAALDALARLTYWGRHRLVDPPLAWLDATDEWTVPTLFSVAVTAAVAVACARNRAASPCWRVLAILFAWLAVDDLLGLHELVGALVHPWVRSGPVYSWVVVLGPVFAAVAGLCLVRVWRGLGAERRALFGGGFGLLAVALALECAEGTVAGSPTRLRGLPLIDYAQWLEEACELFGPVLLLAASWGATTAVVAAPVTSSSEPSAAPGR